MIYAISHFVNKLMINNNAQLTQVNIEDQIIIINR